MALPGDEHSRLRRSTWAMVAYLLGFAVLITIISRYYLIPAMQAANEATAGERRQLSAYSMLLMAIVLLIVVVGIILTFRISRFFFPRPAHPRATMKDIDAWSESARRMSPPCPDAPDDT
jgi:lysylphosphatidylglycerol synthetase-like protein (DUF2156 family)